LVIFAAIVASCSSSRKVLVAQSIGTGLQSFCERLQKATQEANSKPSEPPWTAEDDALPPTLEGQREQVLRKLRERLGASQEALDKIAKIFSMQKRLGQGNPKVTQHPMTRAECRELRMKSKPAPTSEICGAPNMVAIYSKSKGETEKDAKVCIDQFEFPNIPCEYPLTWVQANQAQMICNALGKRMCDAHEWEGACFGDLRAPEQDYLWNLNRPSQAHIHNLDNVKNGDVRWAYGPEKDHKKCGTTSKKSDKCQASEWERCGSNTFPAGAFPECVSTFGVYDQHGNAAEHMSIPMKASELGSRGGIGSTEMKGSWFIFASYEAHKDDCRWRAPDWHDSKVMAPESHANYHLSFRCCKDIQKADKP
jgi:hypothetical protein